MSDTPINQPLNIDVGTGTEANLALANDPIPSTSSQPNIDVGTETTVDNLALEDRKFKIIEKQEETRGRLALYLLIGLGVTLIGIGVYVFFSLDDVMTKRELITLIWTSEVTLVSGALGFYFGRGSN